MKKFHILFLLFALCPAPHALCHVQNEKSFSGNELDVSELLPGVYFISIKDTQNTFTGKFVKTVNLY